MKFTLLALCFLLSPIRRTVGGDFDGRTGFQTGPGRGSLPELMEDFKKTLGHQKSIFRVVGFASTAFISLENGVLTYRETYIRRGSSTPLYHVDTVVPLGSLDETKVAAKKSGYGYWTIDCETKTGERSISHLSDNSEINGHKLNSATICVRDQPAAEHLADILKQAVRLATAGAPGDKATPAQVTPTGASSPVTAAPAITAPALAVPNSGTRQLTAKVPLVAPFEIRTPVGGYYLVKLVKMDDVKVVMTVFIHGGMTESIKAPLGTYELRYAYGERWYGYDDHFGPATEYFKMGAPLNFIQSGNRNSGFSIFVTKEPPPAQHVVAMAKAAF